MGALQSVTEGERQDPTESSPPSSWPSSTTPPGVSDQAAAEQTEQWRRLLGHPYPNCLACTLVKRLLSVPKSSYRPNLDDNGKFSDENPIIVQTMDFTLYLDNHAVEITPFNPNGSESPPLREIYQNWLFSNIPREGKILYCATHGESWRGDVVKGLLDRDCEWNPNNSFGRVIHPDPVSKPSMLCMKEWIKNCESDCKECGLPENPVIPTRFLDVRDSTIKLVDTESLNLKEHPQYTALSHCWGACRTFLTTEDSLPDRMRGFNVTSLPRTFQDAVRVTRELNIPFLWIDSLCVIQGDAGDWQKESAKMGDIYSNAYLTIAAWRASDDNQGFLHRRLTPRYRSVLITIPNEEPIQIVICQLEEWKRTFPWKRKDEPLHTRAWTLQERLLSRRTIGFGSDQMYWECRSRGLLTESGNGSRRSELPLPFTANLGDKDLQKLWAELVREYCTRNLSYKRDKLPALSGLASRLAKAGAGVYLAGHWEKEFIQSLTWQRFTSKTLSRPQEWRAPSWSWTSCDGFIRFFPVRNDLYCKILEASVKYAGANPFGEVENGYAVLMAPCGSMEFEKKDVFGVVWIWSGRQSRVHNDLEGDFDPGSFHKLRVYTTFDTRRRRGSLFGIVLGQSPQNDNLQGLVVEAVHDGMTFGRAQSNVPPTSKYDDVISGTYIRVGTFTSDIAQSVHSFGIESLAKDMIKLV